MCLDAVNPVVVTGRRQAIGKSQIPKIYGRQMRTLDDRAPEKLCCHQNSAGLNAQVNGKFFCRSRCKPVPFPRLKGIEVLSFVLEPCP